MDKTEKTLRELSDGVLAEMERLHYRHSTMEIYRNAFKRIESFAKNVCRTEYFTEEFGERYLKDVLGFPGCKLTSYVRHHIRCFKKLGEFNLCGAFIRVGKTLNRYDWSVQDKEIIDRFIGFILSADTSKATKSARRGHIKAFYNFLGVKKVSSINDISVEVIAEYVRYMHSFSMVYVKHRLNNLRYYFRFLFDNGLCDKDWSFAVPRVSAPQKVNLPALWTDEEIKNLLGSVDRGNPTGKRNYAILSLVTNLGIRLRDISELKLENLKWERNEIEFYQHKTKKKVIYPMLNDVGWAIIDYIRYARPDSGTPQLFLKSNAPYLGLGICGIGNVLSKQLRLCGIHRERRQISGVHSLRHALARKLMEQNTPLATISEIMGHTSVISSSPYLKVDIDGLRNCTLTLNI